MAVVHHELHHHMHIIYTMPSTKEEFIKQNRITMEFIQAIFRNNNNDKDKDNGSLKEKSKRLVTIDKNDKGHHSQSLQCSRQVQRFESLFILAGEGHF